MSKFSMKPQVAQQSSGTEENGGASQEDYAAWADAQWNVIDGKEQKATRKDGSVREGVVFKKKKMVGKLASIIDLGLQPQKDAEYDSKCTVDGTEDGSLEQALKGEVPDGYSDEEKEHVAKFTNNYFKTVDGKRKQFKPERPQQEYSFYFDFYKAPVDWTKHYKDSVQSLGVKPLRVCYNGHYKNPKQGVDNLARNLRFEPHWQTKKISPNNPIYKMAIAMGVQDEFDKGYDLGELVDGACFFDVYVEKNTTDRGVFINYEIKNFSEVVEIEAGDTVITREQQIPETTEPFIGVHLDDEVGNYDELTLNIVRSRMNHELKAVLPRATAFQPNAVKAPDFWLGVNWEDSGLCKALGGSVSPSEANTGGEKDKVSGNTPKAQTPTKTAPVKVSEPEPEIDFDDD